MSYLQQLHEAIQTYRLDRFPRGKMIAMRLQMTPVSEDEAHNFLMFLSPLIDQQMNNPNLLHPAPDEQQLEKLGQPDIEFLTLESLGWTATHRLFRANRQRKDHVHTQNHRADRPGGGL